MKKYDIAIIGGGVLGTTISYWLSTLYDLKICLIEKEHDVALHSSTRNSGVIHYPFYIDPKKRRILLELHFFLMICGKYWPMKTTFHGFKAGQLKLH